MTVSLADLDREIEEVARPSSFADARRRLAAFARRHDFDNVSLLAPARQTGEEADFVIVSTYPLEWLDHYVTNGFAAIDPLMIEARRQTAPFQLEPVRAATAADDPPELPPGTALLFQGFSTGPYALFSLDEPIANSSQLALPMRMPPALSSFDTAVASYGGT